MTENDELDPYWADNEHCLREIERLRAENERLRDHMRALANTSVERNTAGIFQGMWQSSEQECEQLRAALREIADTPATLEAKIDVARRALEPMP